MNKDAVYELNDVLAAFMQRHGVALDDGALDEAVYAVTAIIEGEEP